MNATKQQLSKIHVMLQQLQLTDSKKDIVSTFSNGRTESSKELSIEEARELIKRLSAYDKRDPLRRKVFALAYECGIIWGESLEDKKMNGIKLNNFLVSRGTVKKELAKMTYEELLKTANQFEAMLKRIEEGKAANTTTSLLKELQIQSSFRRRSKQA